MLHFESPNLKSQQQTVKLSLLLSYFSRNCIYKKGERINIHICTCMFMNLK